jgi:DNA-binding protein WhiA
VRSARRCCRLAEVSALFHAAGAWHLRGRGELAVHLDVPTGGVARRAFALLRDLGVRSQVRTYRRRAFGRETRYQLHVDVDARSLAVLREAGVVSRGGAPLERPPKRVVGRSCCRGAYLRGALLGGGTISGPRAPHIEMRTSGIDGARFIAELAARAEIPVSVAQRRTHALAYAKAGDVVADLVATAGAGDLALRLDEHAVVAATRARANRLANADGANLARTARAAHRQLEAIRRLDRGRLPAKLAEIADLRMRHPSLPLGELARKCRPPITKAAAHARMRALMAHARE